MKVLFAHAGERCQYSVPVARISDCTCIADLAWSHQSVGIQEHEEPWWGRCMKCEQVYLRGEIMDADPSKECTTTTASVSMVNG